MRCTRYGRRISHGALLVGFMSTASTMMVERHGGLARATRRRCRSATTGSASSRRCSSATPCTVTYTIAEVDPLRRRSRSRIEVANQHGETVAVAEHILKWVPQG